MTTAKRRLQYQHMHFMCQVGIPVVTISNKNQENIWRWAVLAAHAAVMPTPASKKGRRASLFAALGGRRKEKGGVTRTSKALSADWWSLTKQRCNRPKRVSNGLLEFILLCLNYFRHQDQQPLLHCQPFAVKCDAYSGSTAVLLVEGDGRICLLWLVLLNLHCRLLIMTTRQDITRVLSDENTSTAVQQGSRHRVLGR